MYFSNYSVYFNIIYIDAEPAAKCVVPPECLSPRAFVLLPTGILVSYEFVPVPRSTVFRNTRLVLFRVRSLRSCDTSVRSRGMFQRCCARSGNVVTE